jgi:hypothetical protein
MIRNSVRGAVIVLGVLLAGAPAGAQQNASPSQGTQGFNVVLVLGDLQGGASSDNIPPAARAALGDLKDFLPYRSYRVLDSSWILGSTTQLFRAKSRLRGADDQTYEVRLTSSPTGPPAPPSLQMKFVMQDLAGGPRKEPPAAVSLRNGRGASSTRAWHSRADPRSHQDDRRHTDRARIDSGRPDVDRHVVQHAHRRNRRRRHIPSARGQSADRAADRCSQIVSYAVSGFSRTFYWPTP